VSAPLPPIYILSPSSNVWAFCSMIDQAGPARRGWRSTTISWCGIAHARWRSTRWGLMG